MDPARNNYYLRKRYAISRFLGGMPEMAIIILIALWFMVGCSTTTPDIPEAVPDLSPAALQSDERTYEVEEFHINVNGMETILDGTWYIVSIDTIKENRRNQERLGIAMAEVTKARKNAGKIPVLVFAGVIVGLVGGHLFRTRR